MNDIEFANTGFGETTSENIVKDINKIKTMQNKIKHLKADKVALNGIIYKPYTICSLPPKFGTEEITTWFNYRGYTYISE